MGFGSLFSKGSQYGGNAGGIYSKPATSQPGYFAKGGTWKQLRDALEKKPVVVGEEGPELLTADGVVPTGLTRRILKQDQTEELNERLPDGTPAIDVGLPEGLKRLVGRVNLASAAPQDAPPDVSGIRSPLIARVDSGVSALPRQNDSAVVADTLPNLSGLVNRVNPADALFNNYRNQPLATDSSVPDTTLGVRRLETVDNRGVMPAPNTNVVPVGVQRVSGLPRVSSNEFAAPSVTQTSAPPAIQSLSQLKPTSVQFNAPSVQGYGQSNTPGFNAPSVQAMVRPKADTQSDSTVPNIGVRPVQTAAPQDQQDAPPRVRRIEPQQEGSDASVVPVEDRRSLIMDGQRGLEYQTSPEYDNLVDVINGKADPSTFRGLTPSQMPSLRSVGGNQASPAAISSVPDASTADPRAARAEQRRAQLEDRFAKLLQLEGEDVKDKNGRVKSGLLGALRGFLQGGIMGGITQGIYGVWHPEYDEQIKHAAKVLKERGKLDEAMKIENEFARLDAMDAQAGNRRTAAGRAVVEDATRKLNMIRANNGGKRPDTPEVSDLLQQAGFSNGRIPASPRGTGPSLNPQDWKIDNGQGWYLTVNEEGERVMVPVPKEGDYEKMTPNEKASFELRRLENNRYVAEYIRKYGPQSAEAAGLRIIPSVDSISPEPGSSNAPAPNTSLGVPTAPAAPTRGRRTATPSSFPAGIGVGRPIDSGGRGGRSYSRGSSGGRNDRDQGFAESGVADARARAAEARARGDEESAQAWEAKAEVEDRRLKRAGGTPSEPSQKPDAIRAVLGGGAMQAAETGAGMKRQYTEAEIRANAKTKHLDPDAAVRFARQNGRLKRGN